MTLIIDELSLGLAPVAVQQLAATLKALTESGMTLVEQNMYLALNDYASVISEGPPLAEGPSCRGRCKVSHRQAYLVLQR